jgi:serine/threonine protein kinase
MIRCPHCGLLHVASRSTCPTTGLAIGGDRSTERRALARQTRPPAKAVTDDEEIRRALAGRYRILGVLGQGGMGTVFDAVSERTHERVAVKVLKKEHSEKKESVARMRHEATVVGRIRHPNICNVLEFGLVPGSQRPFLVMEKLQGETLAARLERENKIPVELGVEVALQALAALDAAHAVGVIHRDMKPDNIFLGAGSGVIKVLDFGISKATMGDDQPHHLTRTGMVMGTPYYMAPEQAMGERQLDARVDVWGMGVLLYEALTGQRPFIAKNYNALLVQILTADPQPAAIVEPSIPVALSNIIHRALAKKRDERFTTAREFAQTLLTFRIGHQATPFRQAARVRAAIVVEDSATPSSTPSPASRRTVRMRDSNVPLGRGAVAERAQVPVRQAVPVAQTARIGMTLPMEDASSSGESQLPTQRPPVVSVEGNPSGRRNEGAASAAPTAATAAGEQKERELGVHDAQKAPGKLAAQTSVPRRAGPAAPRRRSEPPQAPKKPVIHSFDTADSTFSVSAGDEDLTQLYEGSEEPVGDDTPTVEENDLTVVDSSFHWDPDEGERGR